MQHVRTLLSVLTGLYKKPLIRYFAIASIGALAQIYIFFPGAFTNDSFAILVQAKNLDTLSDWHPPIMALLWHILLPIGQVLPMLILQAVMFWSALAIIATALYIRTKSFVRPLFILFLGITPPFFADSGMIWKDNHATYSLLIAAATALYVTASPRTLRFRRVILSTSAAALVYALLLRHNILPAVLPMTIYLFWLWLEPKKRNLKQVAIPTVGLLVIGMVILPGIIAATFSVRSQHSSSQVMSDDLVYLLSQEEIMELNTTDTAKDYLLTVNGACESRGIVTDTVWRCNDREAVFECRANKASSPELHGPCNNFERIQSVYTDDTSALPKAWISTLLKKPFDYLRHRAALYNSFIFPRQSYVWHPGQTGTTTTEEGVTIQITQPRDSELRSLYGEFTRFTTATMQFFYMPGIAVLGALLGTYYAYTRRQRLGDWSIFFYAMFASASLYVASYFPVVLVNSYRFTYWSTIAVYLCLALMALILTQKEALKTTQTVHRKTKTRRKKPATKKRP